MRLPLVQEIGKIIGRSSKQIRTELVAGLGGASLFEMARKEPDVNWPIAVLCCMSYYDKPCQNQPGVVAFLEAREWRLSKNAAYRAEGGGYKGRCTPSGQYASIGRIVTGLFISLV